MPTLESVAPSTDVDALVDMAARLPFPVFVKAVAGGGGRGMRRVDDAGPDNELLRESIQVCMREGEAAFGDATVFVEQAVTNPRHIEVQILADGTGEPDGIIHLYERDCSVQRRHQKVVEIAPGPHLDPELRDRICDDAVRFAQAIGYRNAGTVEFLVDERGSHVFIETNPRIQVEHTVTEEVAGVDLVQAQLRIAAGETLSDLGLSQATIQVRGTALQCRITTEDPANGFRPDTGTITAYRSPGGAGVRVDAGTAYAGAQVSPHFDSMLAKLTCRGRTYDDAVRRARRAVAEFRIRGVQTNVPFIAALLEDPDFTSGAITTSFIETHPELLSDSVIGFLAGDLGEPPGGWPEPFRTRALEGRTHKAPIGQLTADDEAALRFNGRHRQRVLDRLLFPGPTADYEETFAKYGDLSVLPTREYLYGLTQGEEHVVDLEEGKTLILGLVAIGDVDERGYRTVMTTLNGQLRPLVVRDHAATDEVGSAEKAEPAVIGHVAAPFAGAVTPAVAVGDVVEAGDKIATIEAMKMEAAITAPCDGRVAQLAVRGTRQVDGGDLLLVIE